MAKDGRTLILIKREEVVEGGHHGGAWKVAYADFVTAMMAFFLLMWLLNATTEEQRRGIADYFSPSNSIATTTSGFGAPFGGRTPNSDGSLASDRGAVQVLDKDRSPMLMTEDDESGEVRAETPLQRSRADDGTADGQGRGVPTALGGERAGVPAGVQSGGPAGGSSGVAVGARTGQETGAPAGVTSGDASGETSAAPTDKALQAELEKREKVAFERAAQQIRDAIAQDPALSDLARQLVIDLTPDGLRIQLVDADRQPMFPSGSSTINDRARAVLAKIAPVLLRLPEQVSISGHTDATPYKGGDRSNWDLSSERANATRRLLVEAGLPERRIRSVSGMADRDPLVKDDALAAANRRISIVVLRAAPVVAR